MILGLALLASPFALAWLLRRLEAAGLRREAETRAARQRRAQGPNWPLVAHLHRGNAVDWGRIAAAQRAEDMPGMARLSDTFAERAREQARQAAARRR